MQHCDLDLEDCNPNFSNDTSSANDVPVNVYQVGRKRFSGSEENHVMDQNFITDLNVMTFDLVESNPDSSHVTLFVKIHQSTKFWTKGINCSEDVAQTVIS